MRDCEPRIRMGKLRASIGLTPPVVGTVARLHRQKGVEFLLRAAKDVTAPHPEARIVIVGGGPLEKSLRREAEKEGWGAAS